MSDEPVSLRQLSADLGMPTVEEMDRRDREYRAIVVEFADITPMLSVGGDGAPTVDMCKWCGEFDIEQLGRHEPDCLWVRARTLVHGDTGDNEYVLLGDVLARYDADREVWVDPDGQVVAHAHGRDDLLTDDLLTERHPEWCEGAVTYGDPPHGAGRCAEPVERGERYCARHRGDTGDNR